MPLQSGNATTPAPAKAPAVVGVEVSTAQLHALQARRDLISDQYQSVMAERGRVGQERLNAQARGDAGIVKEYDATIARLGTRLTSLDQQVQAMDRQIDEAMKAPISLSSDAPAAPSEEAITLVPPPEPNLDIILHAQRQEFQRIMAIEAGVLLSLGALLWRFGFAKGRRTAAQEQRTQVASARDDDRLLQAVDAIAIEVERLSEGQRFINNVLATRRPEREALPVAPRTGSTPTDGSRITPH
jgi:hypothetical protein